jgi:nitroimidazol reductase NimA-like FMN-containing flavoprotein (pyridoxamine 5'-phosphate oxidase superfamily)
MVTGTLFVGRPSRKKGTDTIFAGLIAVMRRTDREITDRERISEIIRGCLVCHVASAKDNLPYVVPMSFGYDGAALYLHTAPEGKKVDYFLANPRVCFQFERNVELRRHARSACRWSFDFESVIGYGTVSEVVDPAQKAYALGTIMHQYSGQTWLFKKAHFTKLRVWKITIDSMTGKSPKRFPPRAA